MKSHIYDVTTRLSPAQVGGLINEVLVKAKAHNVAALDRGSNPLDRLGQADPVIAVYGERAGMGSMWRVEVEAYEAGNNVEVTVAACGDGGFSRAFSGLRNTYSLAKSDQVAQQIVTALRGSDPSMTVHDRG